MAHCVLVGLHSDRLGAEEEAFGENEEGVGLCSDQEGVGLRVQEIRSDEDVGDLVVLHASLVLGMVPFLDKGSDRKDDDLYSDCWRRRSSSST